MVNRRRTAFVIFGGGFSKPTSAHHFPIIWWLIWHHFSCFFFLSFWILFVESTHEHNYMYTISEHCLCLLAWWCAGNRCSPTISRRSSARQLLRRFALRHWATRPNRIEAVPNPWGLLPWPPDATVRGAPSSSFAVFRLSATALSPAYANREERFLWIEAVSLDELRSLAKLNCAENGGKLIFSILTPLRKMRL